MSDIDFDELDKAVNTLMSDVPKVEPPKTDDIKTLTINSTVSDDSRPSLAKLDSTLTEVNRSAARPEEQPAVAAPVRTAPPSLASRRGGRFMDVVHPSSDMKTATKPAGLTSRQGVTIEPTGKSFSEAPNDLPDANKISEGIAPEEYKDLTVSDVAAEPKASAPVAAERHTPTNDWPDPLEMSGYSAEPDTNSVEQAGGLPATEPAKSIETEDTGTEIVATDQFDYEDPQSLTSPFITDAKVEKRPLGGGAPADVPVEEPDRAPVLGVLAADDEATDEASDANDQLPAKPGDVVAQLPPELQSDLMAIEADGDAAASEAKEPTVAPAVTSDEVKPVVEVEPVTTPVPETAEVNASAVPTAPAVPAGPTSIPQQYHEEPSTSDEPSGSIYDTDSYHQPLAHPTATKSGWLWIIWILLLLIVGGGGAVALYLMGII